MPNQPLGKSFVGPSNTYANTQGLIEVFTSRAPTITDINFPIGKRWFDTSANKEYILKGFSSLFDVSVNQTVLQANWITGVDITGALEKFTAGVNTTGSFPVLPNSLNRVSVSSTSNTIQVNGITNGLDFNTISEYVSTDVISYTPSIVLTYIDSASLVLPTGTWMVFCLVENFSNFTEFFLSTQSKTPSDNALFGNEAIFSSIFPLIVSSTGSQTVYCVQLELFSPHQANVQLQAIKIGP